MYSKVGLETDVLEASPHRLVSMLFDGLIESMNQAIVAIQQRDIAVKGRSLLRAVRIVDEGLKSALNPDSGELAQDLRDLYTYVTMRLTQANLHNDIAAIEECKKLLQPIREAWTLIGAQADTKQRVA